MLRRALWAVYAVFWVGAVATGGVSPAAGWVAPFFLALAGALAFLERKPANRAAFVAAAAVGFASEIIGVQTGVPFGRYRYTQILAPSVGGVPIVIALAWAILIDFALAISPRWYVAAMVMTAIDLVIDPLACGPVGFWRWTAAGPYYGVPLSNFAGWLLISGILAATQPKPARTPLAGWSVVAFFTALAIEQRMTAPAWVGCALVAAPLALAWPRVTLLRGARRRFQPERTR